MEMDLDANMPSVHCSPAEFNQVVLNIVVNAAHAISEVVGDGGKGKGKIRVRTRFEGEWAIVEISDTGAGMPAHVQQRIFEPFFTARKSNCAETKRSNTTVRCIPQRTCLMP
jgi:signal transduction histidine kinase